jgi:3-phenylpropionate/trans-cinnamate dioxygenase ferredoxin component
VPEWVRVGPAAEIGPCTHRTVGGEEIVLVTWEGEVFALEDQCSHEDYPLSDGCEIANGQIECIYHGARFDLRTGAAKALPAVRPVRAFPVEIRDGDVYIDVGRDE